MGTAERRVVVDGMEKGIWVQWKIFLMGCGLGGNTSMMRKGNGEGYYS